MSGVSKYKYQNVKFDSYKELQEMSLDRLIYLSDLQLNELALYTYEPIIDKNDIYKKVQELLITNKVIKLKLDNDKQKTI